MKRSWGLLLGVLVACSAIAVGCGGDDESGPPTIAWYAFDEPGGSFIAAAEDCTEQADGRYRIEVNDLPADANQQREQLVRRLAAGDTSIDLMGMDVIWTAEFAGAEWILPYEEDLAEQVTDGTIDTIVQSVRYQDQVWVAPFTSNTQLLWYRDDRVRGEAPATWEQMIQQAEDIGEGGLIQTQGQRYEGLTVLFNTLLASAGGSILDQNGEVALQEEPTLAALEIMRDLGQSPAADPTLSTSLEDQSRLAFESGSSAFMLNYPFVYPSARENAPQIFDHLQWARFPAVYEGEQSRVTIGGFNIGVSAFSEHPDLAFEAAACIVDPSHQKTAAIDGGLAPSNADLYDDPDIQEQYPFADLIRTSLQDGAVRPVNPIYNDISLAVQRTLHPMSSIDPEAALGCGQRGVMRAERIDRLDRADVDVLGQGDALAEVALLVRRQRPVGGDNRLPRVLVAAVDRRARGVGLARAARRAGGSRAATRARARAAGAVAGLTRGARVGRGLQRRARLTADRGRTRAAASGAGGDRIGGHLGRLIATECAQPQQRATHDGLLHVALPALRGAPLVNGLT